MSILCCSAAIGRFAIRRRNHWQDMLWRGMLREKHPQAVFKMIDNLLASSRAALQGAGWRVPVAVMSFNRPHYLEPVLDSLAAQTALTGRAIFLFQDNAVSPHSGKRYADDVDIARCVEMFHRIFPSGTVMLAEHNLGIARNFLRAEEFVFDACENDACYFFEDDMILSPHYLTMMDRI